MNESNSYTNITLINQTINESFQSVNQIHQEIKQTKPQDFFQRITDSIHQSRNQTTSDSVNQSTNQIKKMDKRIKY